jgi:phosphatidylserine/phosphatidylglycerophosphate/cardiolipin synthase-like enzyme
VATELIAPLHAPAPNPAAPQRVRWLVDNAEAYDALLAALAAAQRTIWMTQLAFDPDCVAFDHTASETDVVGRRLVDGIIAASVERGVDVRILLNASLLLDTAAPLRDFLHRADAAGVQVRGVKRFPQLLHAKVVVIDGSEAFLVGSPFANGYWDDARHRPADGRRPARELAGRPVHDVSCAIAGPAVASLAAFFVELWNEVSTGPAAEHRIPATSVARRHPSAIRVSRTAPRGVLPAHPTGLAEILAEIEAALASARSLVYVEHQYLSARPVVAALTAALRREPALEVIVVLNQNPDVTAYRGWQNARLREAGLLDHPRVGCFALWSGASSTVAGVRWEVNQRFVHSKVLLVDDRWAMVGSANLDGVSLHSYGDDFAGAAARRIFRHVRNLDVALVLDDSADELDGAVRELRLRLWSEHLGLEPEDIAVRPAEGWLARWRSRAARDLRTLAGTSTVARAGAFVLPYSTRAAPRAQLEELGVDVRRVHLHFDPGWLELYCSPGWVRNMFA